jgi:hypothetical protein
MKDESMFVTCIVIGRQCSPHLSATRKKADKPTSLQADQLASFILHGCAQIFADERCDERVYGRHRDATSMPPMLRASGGVNHLHRQAIKLASYHADKPVSWLAC